MPEEVKNNEFSFENPEYRQTYWHTCSHIMAQAVKRLWPEVKLAIGPSIDEGWYYDMDAPFAFTPEHLEQIEAEMRKICKEKLKLERFELPRDEALKFMEEKGEPFKVELINDLPEDAHISFYKQGEFTDLCAGPHLDSTGRVKGNALKLTACNAAYWRGDSNRETLQRIYGIAFPKKDELDAYLQRIEEADNYKRLGTIESGGYVWHTTGSGKTLTSFKTAQLASKMPSVNKVLFVVDRKDLGYQTMREYDRFEKGAANSNTSTAVLKRQLEDSNSRIIITTIQKLSTFIAGNKGHSIYDGHIVIIFDECHRSQFGDMHQAITKAFKKYNLFGFTGTPIFAENSASGGNPQLRTTEQAFGEKLHTYTIVDAITDKNVLPFRIDYVNTVRVGEVDDKEVSAIDTEKALLSSKRINAVVKYTLDHFAQKTRRTSTYSHSVVSNVSAVAGGRSRVVEEKSAQRVKGFNSIFATASIEAAKRYYLAFAQQQKELVPDQRLKIGLIYSYAANEAESDDYLDDEGFDTGGLDGPSRDFLESAIRDYNQMFGTSYSTSADSFQNYYKDLSLRLKNREIDMVIVVNMFLTGFDATTLNTLWVDKNLKSHGLIQAYSRTNRILNSVKTYGNIVSFRNLEQQTNDALALFGNKDARGVVLLKPYHEYYNEYAEKVSELLEAFPAITQIIGEARKKEFIALYGSILRLLNILTSFDEFVGNEILTERQDQDYRSIYLECYAEFKGEREAEKETINDDVVFEIELIKQAEINVDYILMLVEKYREKRGDGEDKEIRAQITRAVDASPSLRNKRDLVEAFVDSVSTDGEIEEEWRKFIVGKKEVELQNIIKEENLRPEEATNFVERAFRDGAVATNGIEVTGIMKPVSRFSASGRNGEKRKKVIEKLQRFFDRFVGLYSEEQAA